MEEPHFFRHQYTYLVATLCRKIGVRHLDQIEDAVQSSFLTALEKWHSKKPDNPQAWLYRVAYNKLIDEFRKQQPNESLTDKTLESLNEKEGSDEAFEASDDLLHMLFVCCDPAIPEPSQLVIALKILCGFSIKEIALRLFLTEANVHKRYQRARSILSEKAEHFNHLDLEGTNKRIETVMRTVYLVFTEGYLSYSQEVSIRSELCEEAIRLLELLHDKQAGQIPAVRALLALMYLNNARLNSRQASNGDLLLLEEQAREQWDQNLLHKGFYYLAASAEGDSLSRYHLEAAIAAEHCRASSFASTNWQMICQYYQQLETLFPSLHYRLNRAVALAQYQNPEAGLALLEDLDSPMGFAHSYLWLAVKADLHRRNQSLDKAEQLSQLAIEAAPTNALKTLLAKRLRQ